MQHICVNYAVPYCNIMILVCFANKEVEEYGIKLDRRSSHIPYRRVNTKHCSSPAGDLELSEGAWVRILSSCAICLIAVLFLSLFCCPNEFIDTHCKLLNRNIGVFKVHLHQRRISHFIASVTCLTALFSIT